MFSGADIILSVIATSGTRDVCEKLKEAGVKSEQILVNASKGIEVPSLMRMSQVIKDVLPEQKLAILSGPTLAKEVLAGLPSAEMGGYPGLWPLHGTGAGAAAAVSGLSAAGAEGGAVYHGGDHQ